MVFDSNSERYKREAALVKACQKNDRRAQTEFFRLYSGKFLGIALRFAGNEDTANDIVQEAFIRIFTHINGFTFKGSFEGWMRRILINTAIDFMKKHSKLQYEELDTEYNLELSEASEILETMNCEAIVAEIGKLPPGFRTILNLYAIDGYSYPEIAEMLNIKEVTVRSQYMRARQKLALALKKNNIAYYVR